MKRFACAALLLLGAFLVPAAGSAAPGVSGSIPLGATISGGQSTNTIKIGPYNVYDPTNQICIFGNSSATSVEYTTPAHTVSTGHYNLAYCVNTGACNGSASINPTVQSPPDADVTPPPPPRVYGGPGSISVLRVGGCF